MYISKFICGIGATLLAEIALIIVIALYGTLKEKRKNKAMKEYKRR